MSEWNLAALQALIGAEESQGLEFKAAGALNKSDEICKDVSAMANAAGGVIIYGLEEEGRADNGKIGVAKRISGADRRYWTKDRLQQIINQGIEPQLDGFTVERFDAGDGSVVFVVEISQASTWAPHQSRGYQRYYMRHGTEVLAMYDHQIRDVMRRHSAPEIMVNFELHSQIEDGRYPLSVECRNLTPTPAEYFVVDIFLDPAACSQRLYDPGWGLSNHVVYWPEHGPQKVNRYTRQFITPAEMPLFREYPRQIFYYNLKIEFNTVFLFGYRVACPGFEKESIGTIFRNSEKPSFTIA